MAVRHEMLMTDVRRPRPRSLDEVRDPDGDPSYPTHLLAGAVTGLVLFAARWYGRQDAIHFADAGIRTTCVDVDEDRLRDMARVYPPDWEFVADDVFEFAAAEYGEEMWDVVSLDPFSQDFNRCAALMDIWTGLAAQAVVIGAGTATVVEPPRGWRVVDRRKRSDFDGGVYWVGLQP